ncbi:monooxygenase [Aspergillus luchuensis IFO 4308]|nr:monooxygenase [Aspergillus luchuensis IFO 4308]
MTLIGSDSTAQPPGRDEYPQRADLRRMMNQNPLPTLPLDLIDPSSMVGDEGTIQARGVLDSLNNALATGDIKALEGCFYADQAYWKDQLALTWHLRTFSAPRTIAASLLETANLRNVFGGVEVDGAAVFLPATPVLQFIDCPLVFKTQSPSGLCRGKMLLLPVVSDEQRIAWKIWILSTRLESLDVQPEDEDLLQLPGKKLNESMDFETDVFIIGAGNAGVALSARLKALGVESVMVERNPCPGDNWALRYDCMQFHIPTAFCYDKELQTPHLLTRQDLASQVRRYVETFSLNTIHSVKVLSTEYDEVAQKWHVTFASPAGQRKATSKHLVMATGFGSQKPNMPQIAEPQLYKGISVHSADYKNAKLLREQGAKSVMVIGSANTAFDVLVDCHKAGLDATMVVRSPTYIVPLEYVCDKNSLGAYDGGVDAADKLILSLPAVVDGQLARGLFAMLAANEPQRYAALEAAGFPVLDSRNPDCALMHNLLERAGGHYVDVGGTKLIEEGRVNVKAGVEPVAYTKSGLRFSDGSCVDADAIRLDATWGLDDEGEIRGMWKRHLNIDNIWIMGGYTQQHRWHSRTLALQIKAALEGLLPPAYRHNAAADSATAKASL